MSSTDVVINSSTYLELQLTTYEDFIEELTFIHSQLQHIVTDNDGDNCTRFEGMVWWYSLSQHPESYHVSNDIWIRLSSANSYEAMLQSLYDAPMGTGIELTNVCNERGALSDRQTMLSQYQNLEYIASDYTLSPDHYPRTTIKPDTIHNHASNDNAVDDLIVVNNETILNRSEDITVPVYPVWFKLGPVPMVNLPQCTNICAGVPLSSSLDGYRISPYSQLEHFERGLPQGFHLSPFTNQSAIPQSSEVQPTRPPYVVETKQQQEVLLILQPAEQIPRRYSITFGQDQELQTSSPSIASVVTIKHTTQQNGINLIRRPAHQIRRRYSIPFDQSVRGIVTSSETVHTEVFYKPSVRFCTRPASDLDAISADVGVESVLDLECNGHHLDWIRFGNAPYVSPGSGPIDGTL